MADDDVVDFASTCRAHVLAAGDTVIPSRPHRAGKVGEFRAVHGRAGMAILCTGQGGGPVPEAKRLLHMRRRPDGRHRSTWLRWSRSSTLPGRPIRTTASGTYPELWAINGPGF
jgi:hypothetical protein